MDKKLFEKYCNNTCTSEELISVIEWFKESAGNSESKALLLSIWDGLADEESNKQTDFNIILDKIHHKINLGQSKKMLDAADQNLIKYNRRKHFLSILTKAAAILIFPVLTYSLYTSFKYRSTRHNQIFVTQAYNEVFSSVDAITKVVLPDSSMVWLNHSSSLKYPAMFRGDYRAVELTGEGYFEVAHNPKIPFIVKAGKIQIKAVGTTFNIMSYPEEDRIETSLIEGCVELQQTQAGGKVITISRMKPNELAIFYTSNNETSTLTITDDRYFSWKDGKLVFNKEPIVEVVKKLSRWFNVDIQIKDPELLDLTYTATFVHETLPQVMELMALVSPVKYTISDRQETSTGTFSKRKIILNYRKK
jgi:ferric-dicitrate binding protein FerR (iron transport regulator)